MRKWGLIVTLFYSLVVLALLMPLGLLLASNSALRASDFRDMYASWIPWACGVPVILGEILLLWLTVDAVQKRLKPRTHILVSALTAGLFLSVLTVAIILAFGFGVKGDKFFDFLPDSPGALSFLIVFGIPWLIWGILFYRLCRNSTDPVTCAVAWLFRGSVLELLIAVPAHVMIRRRHDCSAPVINSWGIASGIAIMLMSFGPSVLLLYKKRMETYAMKATGREEENKNG